MITTIHEDRPKCQNLCKREAQKSLYFSLLKGIRPRERFAPDCTHRKVVKLLTINSLYPISSPKFARQIASLLRRII
jgi:hypothetical protein